MKFEFSIRYGVVGVYLDRDHDVLRVYPVPFVRITFQLREKRVES